MAEFYTSEDTTGDLPLDPFASLHAGYLDAAKRVLQVLEACNWQWTVNEILEQPQALLDTVVALRANGIRMKIQSNNKKNGTF